MDLTRKYAIPDEDIIEKIAEAEGYINHPEQTLTKEDYFDRFIQRMIKDR